MPLDVESADNSLNGVLTKDVTTLRFRQNFISPGNGPVISMNKNSFRNLGPINEPREKYMLKILFNAVVERSQVILTDRPLLQERWSIPPFVQTAI